MANREAVLAAWAVLAMAWPDRVNRMTGTPEALMVLLGALEDIDDGDLIQAARTLITERTTLYPDDNPLAIIREEAQEQEQRRLSRERRKKDVERVRLESIENLAEKAREVTDEEHGVLAESIPSDSIMAAIHRMRCKGIRARLAYTNEDRETMRRKLAELTAETPKGITDGS